MLNAFMVYDFATNLAAISRGEAFEMDDAKREQPEISFEYKISNNYTVLAITGVYGGLNSQGQVIMNFFNERHPIPKTQTFTLLENGALASEPVSQDVDKNVIRDVLVAISISPQNARLFADWLLARAHEHDELVKRKHPDAESDSIQ